MGVFVQVQGAVALQPAVVSQGEQYVTSRALIADKSVIVGIERNSMPVHFRFVPVRLMKQLHFLDNVFHALARHYRISMNARLNPFNIAWAHQCFEAPGFQTDIRGQIPGQGEADVRLQ